MHELISVVVLTLALIITLIGFSLRYPTTTQQPTQQQQPPIVIPVPVSRPVYLPPRYPHFGGFLGGRPRPRKF